MEGPILIAIITAITSCVVAIVSLISTKSTSRSSGHMALELEKLKFELEQKRKAHELKFDLSTKQISSIERIITVTQDIKEIFRQIVLSSGGNIATEYFLIRLKELSCQLTEIYSNESFNFDNDTRQLTHDLKSWVCNLEICTSFMVKGAFVNLSDCQKSQLLNARKRLTRFQNALQERRRGLVDAKIGK
ncbi:MAG: hypothetical protein JO154_02390 [Chitinophaga sp.]|uniref:hypothetical protein n=1 Tax=Chitinophaga sp. TaxID=1869181 RepID=UPI0025BD88A6|nr:hypothetical protein [Chitinophaga sp.]MBV8251430.1 hypothetical protein [Chitinophaga sp.]